MKGIIFDMDGVLIRCHHLVWESFNQIFKEEGLHLTDEQSKRFTGISLHDMLTSVNEECGTHFETNAFSKKAGDLELARIEKEITVDSHLLAFVKDMHSQNIPMVVGTSSMRWRAQRILKHLGLIDYFQGIVTVEDVEHGKPAPDIFLKCAKTIGVDPQDCVVFEDALSGLTAARAGGMKPIGRIDTFTREQLEEKADLVFKEFNEINYEVLSELFK